LIKKIQILEKVIGNNLPLLIFSLAYYGIIILMAGYINVWEDEIYSLNTTSGNLSHALNQSLNFEVQPPVYFLILTIWRTISGSILWARLFSIVSIIVSQFFLFRFIEKSAGRQIANISSILFLLNPFTIFTILEIRLFAFMILLSLTTIIYFYNSYYTNNLSGWGRFLFIVLTITGIFTQYFYCFLLVALALVLLVEKKGQSFRLYILDMIIPLCLVFLFIPHILQAVNVQTSIVPEYNKTFVNKAYEDINILIDRILTYLLPLNFSAIKVWIFKGFFFILLFTSIDYAKLKQDFRSLSPFFVMTLVILSFFFVVHLIFGIHYSAYKYTTVLFIPLLILMVLLFKFFKGGLLNFWLVLLVIFYVTADFKEYRCLYKVKDFRSLSNYIDKTEEKEEPIFVYRNISAENMSLYYKGINKIVPVPEAFSYNKAFSPEQWEISTQDLNELEKKLMEYSNFYVVIDNSPLKGVNESKTVLLEFLLQNFNLIEERSFKGEIVAYKFSNKNKSHIGKTCTLGDC
jgi:hypothetical protein